MVDVFKCLELKKLQWSINSDIDRMGETTLEKADKLDQMLDMLSDEEMNFVLEGWGD